MNADTAAAPMGVTDAAPMDATDAVLMGVSDAVAMGANRAVLVGVDIVEVDRIVRAGRRGGGVFDRRLTTVAERDLGPGPAAFSVKESLIKAVGGRPPGFAWHDFEAELRPPAGWGGSLLEEAAGELAASTGLPLTEGAAYTVRGASGRAALRRLRPEGGADGTVTAAARWGIGDGLFVSLAIVYVEGSV